MPMNARLLRPRAARGYDPALPSKIANLQGWWDAADPATLFDADTGGSATANLGDVGRWEDKSGNGRHATQGIGANRPQRQATAFSGRGGIYFDGNNDRLVIPSSEATFNFLHNATGGHVFFVLRPDSGQSGVKQFISNGTNGGSISSQRGTSLRWSPSDEAFSAVVANPVSGNGIRLVRTGSNGSAASLTIHGMNLFFDAHNATADNRFTARRDRNAYTTTAGTETAAAFTANATQSMTFGASAGTAASWLACLIGEIIMYSGALSTANRDAIENYLAAKWGAV